MKHFISVFQKVKFSIIFISLNFSFSENLDVFKISFCEIIEEFHFISKCENIDNFREFQSEMKHYYYK